MMDIVQYSFFINAFVAILLIAVVSGIVGTYIVSRRMLFITGGITHSSFGGLGLGMFLGVSPMITALLFALASAFGVELISRGGKVREDSAIAVFWALGMALGIIFVFITPSYNAGLTSFLFGNILTVTRGELIIYSIFAISVITLFYIYNKKIVYTAFDRDFAYTKGVNVRCVEYLAIIIISLSIILSIRLVGIMLLLSFLSLPQMSVEIYTHSYNKISVYSSLLAVLGGVVGLVLSTFINIPTGATIVFVFASIYMIARIVYQILKKRRYNKTL